MDDSPSNIKLVLAGAAVVALIVLVCILIFKSGESRVQQAGAAGFYGEQQKMMREALDMAREARAMQRQHMREMQEAINSERETPPTDH